MTALRELAVGQTFETVVVEDLKRTQIVQYAGASGDYNPLHTDEIYTTKIAGYPSVFAHGMLTMGLTGQAIAGLVGAENLLRFGVRFTAQVWPGDTLTVRCSVARIIEAEGAPVAEFSVSTVAQSTANGEGREVMSGYAHARLATLTWTSRSAPSRRNCGARCASSWTRRRRKPTCAALMATEPGYDADAWHRMAEELGLLGMAIPEEHGGAGAGFTELGIVAQEMGRALFCGPFLGTAVLATASAA